MIDYAIYGFALIGALVILNYVIFPSLYLLACAIGYTRFRMRFHKGTWKKVGVKKALKHILWVWPLQGFLNGDCEYITMNSLKWYPPFRIEEVKQPGDE